MLNKTKNREEQQKATWFTFGQIMIISFQFSESHMLQQFRETYAVFEQRHPGTSKLASHVDSIMVT